MKFEDFEVGKEFYSGSGKWICTDKGIRTIIAVRVMNREAFMGKLINCLGDAHSGFLQNKQYGLMDEWVWQPMDFDGCDLIDRFVRC